MIHPEGYRELGRDLLSNICRGAPQRPTPPEALNRHDLNSPRENQVCSSMGQQCDLEPIRNTPRPAVSKAKVKTINMCVEILNDDVKEQSGKEESGPRWVGRNRRGRDPALKNGQEKKKKTETKKSRFNEQFGNMGLQTSFSSLRYYCFVWVYTTRQSPVCLKKQTG